MSKRSKAKGRECTKRKKRTRQGKAKETVEKSNRGTYTKNYHLQRSPDVIQIKVTEHNIL
jgi:hypothetical protein